MNIYIASQLTDDLEKQWTWLAIKIYGDAKNRTYITSNQSVHTSITCHHNYLEWNSNLAQINI